ncbi:hypothetical protein L226DRAFT_443101, partial [Lentinus tigrinus ALCF2SS1-7]|uniref:uncharacterized protein n=1 Tax=Lentinus tigrinus ALCF2SS1-7 TaxID=1328758 RepID=UPI001165E0AF
VIPPLSEVTSRLADGVVPVVVFDREAGRLSVRSAPDAPYVAISHVWSDGLGSTTEEGLPTCQVARIAGLAKELLPASGAFWMDSLCVPNTKDLRKRAIKLMGQTYEDAHTVLVFDVGIRASCARSHSWEENVLRIATSGWVTRVWTLQEGILARKLYFEFADGLMDARKLESFDGDPAQHMAQQFSRGLLPLLSFRARRLGSPNTPCTLRDIIMLARRRTTSKPEDETIAIAGLLPIDVSALLSITGDDAPERRMKEFILQMRQVPRRWPLVPTDKLRIPGFTWAPRSLADALESDDTDGDGTCTENGLLAQYTV